MVKHLSRLPSRGPRFNPHYCPNKQKQLKKKKRFFHFSSVWSLNTQRPKSDDRKYTTVKILSIISLSLFSSGAPRDQKVGSIWFGVWEISGSTLQGKPVLTTTVQKASSFLPCCVVSVSETKGGRIFSPTPCLSNMSL